MQIAYLNNPSEETIFGSNRIKKQHETMKWGSYDKRYDDD